MNRLRTTQIEVTDDVIDLGIGQPTPSLLPVELLHQAAGHRLGLGESDF